GMSGKWLGNQIILYKADLDGVVSLTTVTSYAIPFDLDIASPIHKASGTIIGRDVSLRNQKMDIELDLKLQPAGFTAKVNRACSFLDVDGNEQKCLMPKASIHLPPSSRQELLEDTLEELKDRVISYYTIHSTWHAKDRLDPKTVLKILGEKEGKIPGKLMDLDLMLLAKEEEGKYEFTANVDFTIPFSHEMPAPIHEITGLSFGNGIQLENRPMHINLDFKLEEAGFFGVLNRDFSYLYGEEELSLKLSPRRIYEAPGSQNELLEEILDEVSHGISRLFGRNRTDLEVNLFEPRLPLSLLGERWGEFYTGELFGIPVELRYGINEEFMEEFIYVRMTYQTPFEHHISAPIHEFSGVKIGKDIHLPLSEDQQMEIVLDFVMENDAFTAKLNRSFNYKDAGDSIQNLKMAEVLLHEPPADKEGLLAYILEELSENIYGLFAQHRTAEEIAFFTPNYPFPLLGMQAGKIPGEIIEEPIDLVNIGTETEPYFHAVVDFTIPFSHEIAAPVHEISGMRLGEDIMLKDCPMQISLDFKLEKTGFFGRLDRSFMYGPAKDKKLSMSARRLYEAPQSQNELLEEILLELSRGIETLFASNRSDLEVNFFDPAMPLDLLGTNPEGILKGEFLGEEVDIEVGPEGMPDKLLAHLKYDMPFAFSMPAPLHETSGVQIGNDIELLASDQQLMHISLDFVIENEGFTGTLNRHFDYADAAGVQQSLKMAERQIHESPADKEGLLADILEELNQGIDNLFAAHRTPQEISFFSPHYPLPLLGMKDDKIPGRFLEKTISLTATGVDDKGLAIADAQEASYLSFNSAVDFLINFTHAISAPVHKASGARVGEDILLVDRPMQVNMPFELQAEGFLGKLERSFTYEGDGKVHTLTLAPRQVYEAPASQNELLEGILLELSEGIENLFDGSKSKLENEFFEPVLPLALLGQKTVNIEGTDQKQLIGQFLGEEILLSPEDTETGLSLKATLAYQIHFTHRIPAPIHEYSGIQIGHDIELMDEENIMDIKLEFILQGEGFLGTLKRKFNYKDSQDKIQTLKLADLSLHEPPSDKNTLLVEILDDLTSRISRLFAQHRTLQEQQALEPAMPLALLGGSLREVPGKFLDQTITLTQAEGEPDSSNFSTKLNFSMTFSGDIPAPIHEYSGMKIGRDISLNGKEASFDMEIKLSPSEFEADLKRSFSYGKTERMDLPDRQIFTPPPSRNDMLGEMLGELRDMIGNLLTKKQTGVSQDPTVTQKALKLLGSKVMGDGISLDGTFLEEGLSLAGNVNGAEWNFSGAKDFHLPFSLALPATFDELTGAQLSEATTIEDGIVSLNLNNEVETEDYLGIISKLKYTYTDRQGVQQEIPMPDKRLYTPPPSQNALLGLI
ncbi:MAG: hypothetical protein AAF696_23355, partial [Bacteroidota bacterium]